LARQFNNRLRQHVFISTHNDAVTLRAARPIKLASGLEKSGYGLYLLQIAND